MIKSAAKLTKSGVISVFATPTTLASKRYGELKRNYAKNLIVLEPYCADWPAMIEYNQVDNTKIELSIKEVLNKQADVIVLGCTHFHWIEANIIQFSQGQAKILQPEAAIIAQLKRVIGQLA